MPSMHQLSRKDSVIFRTICLFENSPIVEGVSIQFKIEIFQILGS